MICSFSCSSGSKVYSWNFQLAPVSVPLLGADILEHFNLLVDIKGRKLVHADALSCPFSPVPASEVHKEFRSESSGQVQISPSALPVFSAMPLDLSTTNFYFSTLPALQSECPSVQSMLSSPSLSVVSILFQRSSV